MKKFISFLVGMICMGNLAFASDFTLQSPSFAAGSIIPTLYSCDGKNVSPALSWSGAPAGTKTFALIVSDPDAPSGTFYHWVLFNLPAKVTHLNQAIQQLPTGTVIGTNTWQQTVYKGPCPPKNATHRYLFTLYALDKMLPLSSDADAVSLIQAMQHHILAQTELRSTFHH